MEGGGGEGEVKGGPRTYTAEIGGRGGGGVGVETCTTENGAGAGCVCVGGGGGGVTRKIYTTERGRG